MNRNGSPTGNEPSVGHSFSGLAHDVIELGELQTRLLAMDLSASSKRIRTTVTVALIGLAVLLGCVPVALLTLAEVLIEQGDWSRWLALGTSTLVGLALASVLFAVVWQRIQDGWTTFDRSRDEFRQNIAWLKSTLRDNAEQADPQPLTTSRSN